MNDLNQNDMAKKLNVLRGYINQVLNGKFNFPLKKLIELSLAMEKIPSVIINKIENENSNIHSVNGSHKNVNKIRKAAV